MKYPVVYVQWRDATSVDDWQTLKQAKSHKAMLIHTVGWLIASDKERFVVALTLNPEAKTVSQTLIIPRGWCEVLKTLRPPA